MAISPEDLITGKLALPSLPEIYLRLSEAVDDPASSARDIGRIIEADSGLCARLLKIVNSAYYGFPAAIATVDRAVTVVGVQDLRNLTFATTVVECFAGMGNSLMSMHTFWSRSVRCALLARAVGREAGRAVHAQEDFVAGLLCDVGSLVLYNRLPELARAALIRARHEELPIQGVERELLGFDHADVGMAIATQWNLPDALRHCLGLHHRPHEASDYRVQVWLISLADALAPVEPLTAEAAAAMLPPGAEIWSRAGASPSVLESVVGQVNSEFGDVLGFVWA